MKTQPTAQTTVESVFRALSEPLRLRILHLLRGGELCVCDLVNVLDIPQPTASRHLAYLRKSGLVLARKDGLWHYYRLVPARSAFHKQVLECVAAAAAELPVLNQDTARIKDCGRADCCD
jgi:ArsR family transcriptional regulator